MVKSKHKGPRAKSRHIMKKSKREKGRPTVNKMMQTFNEGDMVHVKVDSSVHSGMPHRRFIGKTGIVIAKKGRCYIVNVKDMNAKKDIILHPAHLSPAN